MSFWETSAKPSLHTKAAESGCLLRWSVWLAENIGLFFQAPTIFLPVEMHFSNTCQLLVNNVVPYPLRDGKLLPIVASLSMFLDLVLVFIFCRRCTLLCILLQKQVFWEPAGHRELGGCGRFSSACEHREGVARPGLAQTGLDDVEDWTRSET